MKIKYILEDRNKTQIPHPKISLHMSAFRFLFYHDTLLKLMYFLGLLDGEKEEKKVVEVPSSVNLKEILQNIWKIAPFEYELFFEKVELIVFSDFLENCNINTLILVDNVKIENNFNGEHFIGILEHNALYKNQEIEHVFKNSNIVNFLSETFRFQMNNLSINLIEGIQKIKFLSILKVLGESIFELSFERKNQTLNISDFQDFPLFQRQMVHFKSFGILEFHLNKYQIDYFLFLLNLFNIFSSQVTTFSGKIDDLVSPDNSLTFISRKNFNFRYDKVLFEENMLETVMNNEKHFSDLFYQMSLYFKLDSFSLATNNTQLISDDLSSSSQSIYILLEIPHKPSIRHLYEVHVKIENVSFVLDPILVEIAGYVLNESPENSQENKNFEKLNFINSFHFDVEVKNTKVILPEKKLFLQRKTEETKIRKLQDLCLSTIKKHDLHLKSPSIIKLSSHLLRKILDYVEKNELLESLPPRIKQHSASFYFEIPELYLVTTKEDHYFKICHFDISFAKINHFSNFVDLFEKRSFKKEHKILDRISLTSYYKLRSVKLEILAESFKMGISHQIISFYFAFLISLNNNLSKKLEKYKEKFYERQSFLQKNDYYFSSPTKKLFNKNNSKKFSLYSNNKGILFSKPVELKPLRTSLSLESEEEKFQVQKGNLSVHLNFKNGFTFKLLPPKHLSEVVLKLDEINMELSFLEECLIPNASILLKNVKMLHKNKNLLDFHSQEEPSLVIDLKNSLDKEIISSDVLVKCSPFSYHLDMGAVNLFLHFLFAQTKKIYQRESITKSPNIQQTLFKISCFCSNSEIIVYDEKMEKKTVIAFEEMIYTVGKRSFLSLKNTKVFLKDSKNNFETKIVENLENIFLDMTEKEMKGKLDPVNIFLTPIEAAYLQNLILILLQVKTPHSGVVIIEDTTIFKLEIPNVNMFIKNESFEDSYLSLNIGEVRFDYYESGKIFSSIQKFNLSFKEDSIMNCNQNNLKFLEFLMFIGKKYKTLYYLSINFFFCLRRLHEN